MTFKERFSGPEHVQVLAVSFLLGLAAVAACSVDGSLKKVEDSLRSHLQVSVAVTSGAPDVDPSQFGPQLKTKDPEILSLTYISKDSALQEAMKDPVLAKSLMLLKENPLPATYLLQYSDEAWLMRDDPTVSLHALSFIQDIRWDPQARLSFRALAQWRWFLKRFAIGALGVLGLWLLVGFVQSIRRGMSKDQRGINMLLGAIGSGIAVGLWGLALSHLDNDATLYQSPNPWWISVVIGLVVGAAAVEDRQVTH